APDSKEIIPELRKLKLHSNSMIRNAASEVLRQIEGVSLPGTYSVQLEINDEDKRFFHFKKDEKIEVEFGNGLYVEVYYHNYRLLSSANIQGSAAFLPFKSGFYEIRVRPSISRTSGTVKIKKTPHMVQTHSVGKNGLKIEDGLTQSDFRDRSRGFSCKVYQVKMFAGRTYTIDLASHEFDAFMRLEDSTGWELAKDDDSGGNLNARIKFRPTEDNEYRIIATTLDGRIGRFSLSIRETVD